MIPVFFRKEQTIFNDFSVSLWNVLTIVWVIGIFIHLYRYVKDYQKDKLLIQILGTPVSDKEKYRTILNSVCLDYNLNHSFEVYEISNISSPMIFSMFHPIILLPADNQYTDQELIFIFRHEIGHFLHHHLLCQFFVHLFTIVYWWNPLNPYIQKQIDALLEISIDHTFSSDMDETIAYLNCLLNVKKQAVQKQPFLGASSSLSLNNFHESVLEKRFHILTHSQERRHFLPVFLSAVSISIFIFSYCFTLRGVGIPEEAKSGEVFSLTEENAYAILNEDGSYDLYLYEQYIETVDSLIGYDSVPVYTSVEDVPQK